MKNKKAIIGLGAIATLLFGVASSIAYLTDTDTTVNVMTVGNVKIEQVEQEWNENGELVDFTQLKPLYPYVGTLGWENKTSANGAYRRFTMENVVDKYVSVKNTGRSSAYVRTIIALEMGEYSVEEFNQIGISVNAEQGAEFKFPGAWVWTQDFVAAIDGKNYNIMVAVHKDPLAAGETTIPSLLQVYLSKTADNKEVEKLDGNGNHLYDILALSQAVQTKGFNDAELALNEAFGDVTAAKVQEWLGGLYVEIKNESEDKMAEKLSSALENGQNVVVREDVDIVTTEKDENGEYNYDAAGSTIVLNGGENGNYGYLSLAFDKNSKADIKNLNITGTGFVELGHHGGSYINKGTYTLENVTIKDITTTLASTNGSHKVSAAFAHYGTATLNDCVMTGSVSGVDGYPAYDAGFVNGTKTFINGGEYGSMYLWNQAHVTITGAKVGTIVSAAITTNNLGKLTISAGTTVDTIKLVPGSYTPAIVIEDGATVGKIIYNDVTYTQTEWLSR